MRTKPNHIYLKAIDPIVNKSRFYKMLILPDLWGGVSLVREYGRIGQPGALLLNWHSNNSGAVQQMNSLAQKKRNRGYVDV